MNSEEYQILLKDPLWIKKRNYIVTRDRHRCTKCGNKTNLNVHHLFYVEGKKPWEYPNHTLITLCQDCHIAWHEEYGIIRKLGFTKRERFDKRIEKRDRKKEALRRRRHNKKVQKIQEYLKHKKIPVAKQQVGRERYRKKIDGVWTIIVK